MKVVVKVGLVIAVVAAAVVAIGVMFFTDATTSTRDDGVHANVTFRGDTRDFPIGVDFTYEGSSKQTLTYNITDDGSGQLPVSWQHPDASPVSISLLSGSKTVQQMDITGTNCVTWSVTPSAEYTISIQFGPGQGAVSMAWQEAAHCG